ncbi:hypothetical protein AGOR_G00073570 [Albula goreensis]|uniref:Uncharacterized protein n=1 Tax=Albula goreensis TaxID=1534307 RepID=A0A8T3DRI5_9TELE|nr:hypothetical protein AGOR_G00073570 [Albula goreensis]
MTTVPIGWTMKQTAQNSLAPLRPIWVGADQTSSTNLLERMINHTTLTTQRVLHQHILEIAEQQSASTSSSGPAKSLHCLSSQQLVGGATEDDKPWTEVYTQLTQEDRERALQQQRESLLVQFTEALSARERLEAELRQGLQVEMQAQFEQECTGLRAKMEQEMRLTVEQACETLKAQVLKEAAEMRQREMEAVHAEAQESMKQCVYEAEERMRTECEMAAQREKQRLHDSHTRVLEQLHDRIQQLEERLDSVTREKMQYERELKKVQCSYRQFIDLTDSSLHSDYLLKLRRLGQEPGLTEAEVQTDDIITVCPPPWPYSYMKVL